LWEEEPTAMRDAMVCHDELVRSAILLPNDTKQLKSDRGNVRWAILVSNQWPLPCEGTQPDRENPEIPGFSLVSGRFGLTASDR
jgi:hypothetical protein